MTPLDSLVCGLASPDRSVSEVARLAGCERTHVYRCIQRYGLTLKQRAKPKRRNVLLEAILALADGATTSAQIAAQVGCSERHVQNMLRIHNAPRLPQGARTGELNHGYREGRTVDLDGYSLVIAPEGHPAARTSGRMLEHRLVMEQELGRRLLESEVVDHIDGLHLHNAPSNLRVFESNRDHLRATISGQRPNWSAEGFAKMQVPSRLRPALPQVDTYRQRKARGDVRLQQILLAASRLGTDSPYLSGTLHHLEQARIDYSSPTTIERALADLCPVSA